MKNLVATEMFIMGPGGGMEKLEPMKELPLYTKVRKYGAGMLDVDGVVIEPANEHGAQKCVSISESYNVFFTIDRYSRPLSKKFGIGTYYYDDMSKVEKSEVLKYIEKAIKADVERAEKKRIKAEADAKELAELPAKFPHLKAVTENADKKEVKDNLMADLKKNFPGIRFSVTKSNYSTYQIRWTDGPTKKEVNAISDKFEAYSSDITGDFYDYTPSLFNRVFGGFKFVFCNRDMSPEVMQVNKDLEVGSYQDKLDLVFNVWQKTSFPAKFTPTGIKHKDDVMSGNDRADFYEITFDTPAPAEVENTEVMAGEIVFPNGVKIVDYSERAIALIGDTKPIKDTLSGLGGRFNFRLTCGAGWIFPMTKKETVVNALNKLS
ncbi:MAG TPA: hypothetical protein PKU82_09730 [Bacteroidia bacterium]|nr:hypothetical protein [Bacteroidia bacterium]HOZ91466.1 hypothetical protein [Bacteroidia bacterium]HRB52075.1 hypothetical protein [Bacteroidia bacterium]